MQVDILKSQKLLERQLMFQPPDRILLQIVYLDIAQVELNGKMVNVDDVLHRFSSKIACFHLTKSGRMRIP